jgi:hypothetical protein
MLGIGKVGEPKGSTAADVGTASGGRHASVFLCAVLA